MKRWVEMSVAELQDELAYTERNIEAYQALDLPVQEEEARDLASRLMWIIGARLG